MIRSVAILFLALPTFPASAAEPVTIPLKDVWALDMAGTRDIRSLNSPADPVLDEALKQIAETRRFDHGFAVRGEGAEALREFLRVRTDHAYWNRLPADQPISLVLFTKPIREALMLDSIERRGSRIIPRFRFAPRDSSELAPMLAIAPIGKLPLGDYYVTPELLPVEQRHRDAGFKEPAHAPTDIGLMGCSFEIVEGPGGPPPPEATVEISLKDIWAYDMPGTRDINEFGSPTAEESLVQKTLLEIRHSWRRGETGMVVQGEGREALDNLNRARANRLNWNEAPTDTPVSLAFFTKGTGPYIHLEAVKRRGNAFTIQYRPVPHQSAMSQSHLALIPVGTLANGKYRVIVEQLPMEQKYVDQGFRQPSPELVSRISGSFSFLVIDRR